MTSATLNSVLSVVRLIGLREDEFRTTADQRKQSDVIDSTLKTWISQRKADDVLALMREANVVASRIYSIQDIMNDEVYKAREDIITVEDADLGPVRMQAVIPKMMNHAGSVWRSGPQLGEDNEIVFKEWLGMSTERFERLRAADVI